MTPRPVNELAASEAPNLKMRATNRVSTESAMANISVPAWEWRRVMRKPCQAKKATAARQMILACWMYELAPMLTFA
jgi:hypothetical protein